MSASAVPVVRLFDVEPQLLSCIPPADHDMARRVGTLPALRVPEGRWEPPAVDEDQPSALLVCSGALTSTVKLAGRASARVLGPGDIFDSVPSAGSLLAAEQEWRALQPTVLAALDGRFLAMTQRWPRLTVSIQRRLCEEAKRAAVLAAIAHLPRVETRLLGLFWHLADRFGRVGPDGVVIPLVLTHAQLGRLTGAQRPTVTIALQVLREAGDVVRRGDGTWWVSSQSRHALVPAAAA